MPTAKSASPRRQPATAPYHLGDLLMQARKAAGYTQQELADVLGVTRRTVLYYESQEAPPLAVYLAGVMPVLGLSADELLGQQAPQTATASPASAKLARRLAALEALAPAQQRQALELLDALIERANLKRARED